LPEETLKFSPAQEWIWNAIEYFWWLAFEE
jgi:hypothetical protein